MLPVRAVWLLLPTVGGALFGAINMWAPLSSTDGNWQLRFVMDHEAPVEVSVLVGSAILKCVCTGIALGSGFQGGILFPLFFVGATAGILIHHAFPTGTVQQCLPLGHLPGLMIDGMPHDSAVQHRSICYDGDIAGSGISFYFAALAMMVAVPAAVAPAPFFLTLLAVMQAQMTTAQAAAIFLCVNISNWLILGTGLLRRFQGGFSIFSLTEEEGNPN